MSRSISVPYQQDLAVSQRLAEQDPSNTRWQRELMR
jgi:hypothetical protein